MKQAKQTNVKSSRGLIQTFKHTTSGTLYPSPTPPGPLPTPVPYPTLTRYPWSRPPPSPPPTYPRPITCPGYHFLFVLIQRFISFLSHFLRILQVYIVPRVLILAFHHRYRMFYITLSNELKYQYGILYFNAIYSYHFCLYVSHSGAHST